MVGAWEPSAQSDLVQLPFTPAPGEQLLWSGRPSATPVVLRGRDAFLIPLSVLWGGFVLFWNVQVWASGAPPGFALFGLPFLVAGFYVTVGRFLLNWYLRRKTRYFLTDRRVIIDGGMSFRSTKETTWPPLDRIVKSIGPDGSGTIEFGVDRLALGRKTSWHGFGLEGHQFFRIEDAAEVVRLLESQTPADHDPAQDTPGWTRQQVDGRPAPPPW